MRYALMQPYLFPYLGYFSLIARTDRWVVFDEAQFIKGGWINRNRFRKASGGFGWFTVPLRRHGHQAAIREVQLTADGAWRRKIKAQLLSAPGAPGRDLVATLLDELFHEQTTHIADLAIRSLSLACRAIGLRFTPQRLSELQLDLPERARPGDWGWLVGSQLGASHYVNPPGGRALFDPDRYAREGLIIEIISNRLRPYSQGGAGPFEPGLSVLDALLWCDPGEVRELVEDYECEVLEVTP